MRMQALLLVACACVAACTPVTVLDHAAVESALPPITHISLEFSPAAEKQVAGDERFNSVAFSDAIATELRSRQMLDQQKTAGRIAVIQVDEFNVRASSNLVLFGRLPSVGVLAGTIRIRDSSSGSGGGSMQEIQVRTEVPLRISQRGTDRNPLKKLYSSFATLMGEKLAATAPEQSQRP